MDESEFVPETENNEAAETQQSIYQPVYQDQPRDYCQPAPARKKKKGRHIVALALVCSLLGGIIGAAAGIYGTALLRKSGLADNSEIVNVLVGKRQNAVIALTEIDTSQELTPAQVYELNVNSTVGIVTSSVSTNFWGYQTTSAASGSGFILSDDGYILTNYHVVEDSTSIEVTTCDGTSYTASFIGYDESNDIAVLKIDAEGLTPVVLGSSDALKVGQTVIAIGNPLGELTFSLTQGVVSALNREVTMSSGVTMDLIQTDCAINSGNSGGALFNSYGEVIGITNAKYSSSSNGASIDNIGFAIPIDSVRGIFESIIENGCVVKPYIGVTVSNVSDELQAFGMPAGALVQTVTADGPAEKAGLQANDIITAANGSEITGSSDLVELVGDLKANDTITLTVYRQNQTLQIEVVVGELIQDTSPKTGSSSASQQTAPGYGGSYGGYGGGSPFGGGYSGYVR